MESANTQSNISQPELIVESDSPLINHQIAKIEGYTFSPGYYICTMYNCGHNTRKSKARVNMVCLIRKIAFHPKCFTAHYNPNTVADIDVRGVLRGINPPKKT